MKKNILALIYVGLCLHGFSQLDRSIIPEAGEPKEVNLKSPEVFKTANGITVILSEDHKIPKVSLRFVAGSDSKIENEKAGLSSMAGELIMSGTSNRTKDVLDNEIDFIGASVNASDNTVSLRCLKKHLSNGMDLMTDVLFNADFPTDEVDRIKKLAASSLTSIKSNADAMADNAIRKVNFPNHPYSNILTEATLQNITREDMLTYYKATFTPKGSYLVVVGDVTRSETEALIDHYFKTWSGDEPQINKYERRVPKNGNQVYFIDKPGAVQSVIYVTFPVDMQIGDPNQIKTKLLNNILGGGGFGNRLTQNLREDKGYTYGCKSQLNITDNGAWMTAGGNFRNTVTDSAIVEILKELEDIATNLVSKDELEQTKSSSAGGFARSLERPSTIANFALNMIKNNMPEDYYQNYLKKLNNVSEEMVLKMAQKHIQFNNCNIIVVGNSEILESLLPFDSDNDIEFLDPYGNPKEKIRPSDLSGKEIIENYLMKVTLSQNMDEVLKKNKSIKSYKEVTELSMAQMPGALTLTKMFKAPKTSAMKMEMNGMVLQSGYFNGKKGYNKNMQTGKKDLNKDEVLEQKKSLGLFPQLNYKKNKITLEVLGIEAKGSKEYYVVQIIDGENEEFHYYDQTTFLLMSTLSIVTAPEGGEPSENFVEYDDYKEINGILFPQTQTMSFGPVTFSGTVVSNEINVDLDFSEFKE